MSLNEHFLWASVFWSAIASGYLAYGWRQKAVIPLVGGGVMMMVSIFLSALTMSLVCGAAMFAVWWLLRHGY